MTPDIGLNQTLDAAARRVRVLLVYQWAARTLCGAAAVCLVWTVASRLRWMPTPSPGVLAGILLGAGAVGIALGFARRITRMDVAHWTERRASMQERLSSAVEFGAQRTTDPLARRQQEDAQTHAAALDLRKLYPIRFSRAALGFMLLSLLLIGAFFLPSVPLFWSKAHREETAQIQARGAEIEKVVRETEQAATGQSLDESKKAAQEIKKLAEAMKKGDLDKKAALVQMNKLTKQIEQQQQELAQANDAPTGEKKSLEQAAAEVQAALEQKQTAVEAAEATRTNAPRKNATAANPNNPPKSSVTPPGPRNAAPNASNTGKTALNNPTAKPLGTPPGPKKTAATSGQKNTAAKPGQPNAEKKADARTGSAQKTADQQNPQGDGAKSASRNTQKQDGQKQVSDKNAASKTARNSASPTPDKPNPANQKTDAQKQNTGAAQNAQTGQQTAKNETNKDASSPADKQPNTGAKNEPQNAAGKPQSTGSKQPAPSAANKPNAAGQSSEAMQNAQEALKQFSEGLSKQNPDAQSQAMQKLADQMQKGGMSPQEMQKLQQQMEAMSKALKGTDLNKAAQQMQKMAQQMAQKPQETPSGQPPKNGQNPQNQTPPQKSTQSSQIKPQNGQPSQSKPQPQDGQKSPGGQMSPQQRQQLADMARQAAKDLQQGGQAARDSKQLSALKDTLKNGRQQLAMGNQGNNPPSPALGQNGSSAPLPTDNKGGRGAGYGGGENKPENIQRTLGAAKPTTKIKGKKTETANTGKTIRYKGEPERSAKSSIPYYAVTPQQRQAMENAVNKENIPAPYRRQVKDYFERIKP